VGENLVALANYAASNNALFSNRNLLNLNLLLTHGIGNSLNAVYANVADANLVVNAGSLGNNSFFGAFANLKNSVIPVGVQVICIFNSAVEYLSVLVVQGNLSGNRLGYGVTADALGAGLNQTLANLNVFLQQLQNALFAQVFANRSYGDNLSLFGNQVGAVGNNQVMLVQDCQGARYGVAIGANGQDNAAVSNQVSERSGIGIREIATEQTTP
jgi:hypothetical protein